MLADPASSAAGATATLAPSLFLLTIRPYVVGRLVQMRLRRGATAPTLSRYPSRSPLVTVTSRSLDQPSSWRWTAVHCSTSDRLANPCTSWRVQVLIRQTVWPDQTNRAGLSPRAVGTSCSPQALHVRRPLCLFLVEGLLFLLRDAWCKNSSSNHCFYLDSNGGGGCCAALPLGWLEIYRFGGCELLGVCNFQEDVDAVLFCLIDSAYAFSKASEWVCMFRMFELASFGSGLLCELI